MINPFLDISYLSCFFYKTLINTYIFTYLIYEEYSYEEDIIILIL